MLPFLILFAAGVAEAATNATSRRLSSYAPDCPTGYIDQTNGNAYWWACGVDNPTAPFGSRGNCAGGAYTDIWCNCACVLEECATNGDCPAGLLCSVGRCAVPSAVYGGVAICAGDADTWSAGYGGCTSYADTNYDFCWEDWSAGYYAYQVCPQCGSCVHVPYCADDSNRRRSGKSCSKLAGEGHCSGGRRRTSGGEAADTCQKTCSLCGSLSGLPAACPSWKLGSRGQSCSEACGTGTCLEGYYPTSYNGIELVAWMSGTSCGSVYLDEYPESPCIYNGQYCYLSTSSTDRCGVVSDYSADQRFCCCQPEVVATATVTQTATTTVTQTATTTVTRTTTATTTTRTTTATTTTRTTTATTTTGTTTATTTTRTTTGTVTTRTATTTTATLTKTTITATLTSTGHPIGSRMVNCTALSDSATDCATRMADSFPLDYCAISSNQQVCQRSCCGKDQAGPIAGLPPQCENLLDFWMDCEIRIDSFFRDCKDYCGTAGGCAFTCCVRENATDRVVSSLGFATPVNCSGNVTDYFQDCDVRIENTRMTGIDLCAVEHTRRGCEKTCCSQPPSPTVEGCEDLEDLWHDCDVRIWDRFLDGEDYCSHAGSRCGCQLTCCKEKGRNGTEPGLILETGTNCSDPAIKDLAVDCDVRLANAAGDGTSYCGVPMLRKSCEKTCCGLLDEPETPACEPDLQDVWPDCEQRIQDRADNGQDYCAIKFDREGCQRTCCGLGGEEVVEIPIMVECSGTEEDVMPDCETRIRDRFADGQDYCNSGDPTDRENCAKSCCLELGLPVVFTVTIEGLGELDPDASNAILAAVADEVNVLPSDVTVEMLVEARRRLQATSEVSAEISVSPPAGLPPQSVANRLDMGFMVTLSDAVKSTMPEEQTSAIAVIDMTRPLTATVSMTTKTTSTTAAAAAPSPPAETEVGGASKSVSYVGVLLAFLTALMT